MGSVMGLGGSEDIIETLTNPSKIAAPLVDDRARRGAHGGLGRHAAGGHQARPRE
jgi:hypothetical protein